MAEVPQALKWVKTMLDTPQKEREGWVKMILSGIRSNPASYISPTDKGDLKEKISRASKELNNLVDYITSTDFDIMGFAPNVSYIRVTGSKSYLDALWIHPFSSPTLVVKHKTLPVIMLVGASLQKDKSTIYEIPPNSKEIFDNPVEGYTG